MDSTADDSIFFFDTEDIQPDQSEELKIAAELQKNHPEIYEVVLKDGVLDLCCECQLPEEEDGAGFDMINVDSASSNEGERPDDNDDEPEGFLMF
jgi:hypothetical protein